MTNKESGSIKVIIIILIMIIIIVGIVFFQNMENTNEVEMNLNVTDTNIANMKNTEVEEELDIESWRKRLWNYFTDYENYFAVRLENSNGKNEIEDNEFLVKKGYDLASIEEKRNEDGTVNKKDLDECLLKYYGKTPEEYDTEMFEYNPENETIKLRDGQGYDSHGTNVLYLQEITLEGKEYVADFDSYRIPENVGEEFDESPYGEFVIIEEVGDSTIMDFDYDKLYESLSKSNLKFQEYRGRDVRIKFEEKEDGTYQINWLSSTN